MCINICTIHFFFVPLHDFYVIKMKKSFIFAVIIGIAGMLNACSTSVQKAQKEVTAGTVSPDTINGIPCRVYVPCDYCQRTDEIFPVLYLQHGMWGNEHDWTEKGRLVAIMDSLLRLGSVREMVVIMPDNCPSRPTAEEERSNAMSGFWEEQFPAFMAQSESRYRISSKPEMRAIAGLSMGGYHTMRVSSVLDGQFAYVGLFSPATIRNLSAPSTARVLWLAIGTEDFLYNDVQTYRHLLEQQHIEYTYFESTGGHEWPNWQEYLVRFLPKLFKD